MTAQPVKSGTGPLLAHLAGDYWIQSSWMATEKTTRWWPAIAHAASYAACFLPVTRNWRALLVIGGTHAVIDRYRLAKYLCWAKNQAAPTRHRYPWTAAGPTGYYTTRDDGPLASADRITPQLERLNQIQDALMPAAVAGDHRAARTLIRLLEAKTRILGLPPAPSGRREQTVDRPPPSTPEWLATALMIVADNTCHVIINRWAIGRWGGK